MTAKVITALTYAETDVPNVSGEEFPADIGVLYHIPFNYSVIGQRLALLLYEKGVKLFEQEKLTVVFSTYLPATEIEDEMRLSNDGSRYITIGLNAEDFNRRSDQEKKAILLATTERILLTYDTEDQFTDDILEAVAIIREGDEDLPLLYRSKCDQKIEVHLSLRLFNNGQCQIYSTIKDKHGDVLRHDHLDDAHCLSVAMQRCGSILIRKNKVIIKPKKNILSKNLKPIEIEYSL
ncbi:hypothetical protein ACKQTC_02030 [Peptococcus simiae]|uniref:Uncharacterized protein n=1 Tax=Peptococcus simiae TaxID=1643805 RepID=A0ABW9GXV2_9FIRM